MASIDSVPTGRTGRLAGVPGRSPEGPRHFARKRDADQFLDAIRGDLAHGMYVDPAGGRTLFQDYAERWRSVQVHRAGTPAQVESYRRLHAYLTPQVPPDRSYLTKRPAGLGEGTHERARPWVGRAHLPVGRDDLQGCGGRSPARSIAVHRDRPAEGQRRRGGPPVGERGGGDGRRRARQVPGPDRVRRRDGTAPGRVLRPHR